MLYYQFYRQNVKNQDKYAVLLQQYQIKIYHSKVALECLLQNILDDLNTYDISFLTAISDTVGEHIRNEVPEGDERDPNMADINNSICCLLITILHNLNERTFGIVGLQKLELAKHGKLLSPVSAANIVQPTEEHKSGDQSAKPVKVTAKQLIDQYFRIHQNRPDGTAEAKTLEERKKVSESATKLVLCSHSISD